jgi:hypothetical protein
LLAGTGAAGAAGLLVGVAVLTDEVVWGGGREATARTSHPDNRAKYAWIANSGAYFITDSLTQHMPPAAPLGKKYSVAGRRGPASSDYVLSAAATMARASSITLFRCAWPLKLSA